MLLTEIYQLDSPVLAKYEQQAHACFKENAYRLTKESIMNKCDAASLEDEHKRAISEYMDYVEKDEHLAEFIWLYYYFQFETTQTYFDNLWETGLDSIPVPQESERLYPGLLKSVAYLLAADHYVRFLQKAGLDKSLLTSYYENYKRIAQFNVISHNTYGFCRLAPFVYCYAYPYIFRVGRLAFQITRLKDYFDVYENSKGERFFAALPGYTYNSDGLQDEDASFCPTQRKENNILYAHTYDKSGHLKLQAEAIDLSEYKLVLNQKDIVLTIHIPDGKKLDIDEVKQSIADARVFFAKNFSEYDIKAIVCHTWFLDTSLREILKEGSNILKFQDMFDLVMGPDNKYHSLFEHIFRVKHMPLDKLEAKNSFQQAMLDRAKQGRKMYWAYGILKRGL